MRAMCELGYEDIVHESPAGMTLRWDPATRNVLYHGPKVKK